jgi:acyl-CoA synthetase (AMP-forming)/AMP-acid ligase II
MPADENPPHLPRISEYVFHHAARQPDGEALVWDDIRIGYGEFAERVKVLSRALLSAGIRRGDRIAMLGMPRPEYMVVMMATADIGAIWMGMHPRYRLPEFRHVVGLAEPKLIFAYPRIDGREYSEELLALSGEFDCVRETVLFDTEDSTLGTPYDQFLANHPAVPEADWQAARDAVEPDDPAVIIFTSGTTGRPKGSMNSHFALIHCAHVERRHWPCDPMRVLQNMPINHIANIGMMSAVCLVAGGTQVFQPRFDAAELLRIIQRERITFWLQSPVQFHLAASVADFDQADLSSLSWMIWGGGPMPQHLVERLLSRGCRLATAYGMTELTAYATYSDQDADAEALAGSIGRPEPAYDVRLMTDDGRVAGVGERGEIQARGRWIMRGYFNQPDATAEAFTADGWFRTGDVAELRSDGNWRLVGRTKEMYKSGGFNIYPREIEICLEEHPAVALTAVLGVPDPLYGEVGHAFVQSVAEAVPEAEALDAWCRERLANYKIPKTFEIMDPLPTLPIGKIDKQSLRKMLEDRAEAG